MFADSSVTGRMRICATAKLSIVAISLVYFTAVLGSPLTVRGWANHDDLYFLRMASAFLSEGWFGPYDSMTLIKGPTFPLFVAFNFLIGLPILLSCQLIYLAACLALARAVALYRVSDWAVVFIFAVAILHPIAFLPEMFTTLRTSLYLSLTIASCAGWVAIPQLVQQKRSTAALLTALATGVCFAAFWMTREEGIWVVPAFVVLPACYLVAFWRERRADVVRKYVSMLSIAASVFAFLYLTVSVLNYERYGYFGKVEMGAPGYTSAYQALARVRAAEWKPYLPVPAEVREKIYAVSPAFRDIRENLESSGFKQAGCRDRVRGHTCGDFASSWFLWALRDAAASAGYYATAQKAEAYFTRLAAEVNAACASGALECNMPGYAFIPPINWATVKLWEPILINALSRMAFLVDLPLGPSPGAGSELFPYVSAITHSRLTPISSGAPTPYGYSQDMMRVMGWAYHPDGAVIDILVQTANGNPISSIITRVRRPDVAAFLKDQKADESGFDIRFHCVDPCYLLFRTDTGKDAKVPIPRDTSNHGTDSNGFMIRYDMFAATDNLDGVVRITPPEKLLEKFDQMKFSIRLAIAQIYSVFLPILLCMAIVSVGWRVIAWRKGYGLPDAAIMILCVFFGAAWGSRILLVSILDAVLNGTEGSSYDYLSPAFSMWALFLGGCVLLQFHRPRAQKFDRNNPMVLD